jgi:hypothetical protein
LCREIRRVLAFELVSKRSLAALSRAPAEPWAGYHRLCPNISGRLKWLFIFAKRGSFQKDATRLAGARFRHGGLLYTAD